MPALDAHRIFLSAVTAEFARYRTELATRFERVSVKAVYQEEFEYHDSDLVEKLYQLILPCDVVIHFVGAAAGAVANPRAVEDFLRCCKRRGQNFLGFWKQEHGLEKEFFNQLTYTQWEAVIAVFLKKSFMSLKPLWPTTDGHPLDQSPLTPTVDDAASQARHIGWLSKTIRRYPQEITESGGSYLEDAFHKIIGFLLRQNAQWHQAAERLQASQRPQRIAPTRLVSRHATDELLGREKELALLDGAWADPSVNLLSIIAWGGVGKTALLAYWVQDRFVKKAWKNDAGQLDPLAYFDWTFYDQGTRRDDATHAGAASVGTFFQTALKHFGDPEPDNPESKVTRLAALIQAQRTLLILDGLEPLQYPLNHPQAGQITDPDLYELLGLLAQRNPGLCVISSRQVLTDFLRSSTGPTRQHDLEDLPLECAVSLLRKQQIIGTDEELEQAAKDYFCHALSLIVLGRFLFVKGGDIRIRQQVKFETASQNRNERITRNAWHVLEAYEQWLASPEGRITDVQALRLTGLFDRPASPDCLAALRRAPAIPGLTDALVPLDDDAWNSVLLRLHDAHLIQLRFPPEEPGSFAPRAEPCELPVDAHPLIREYFAKQLTEKQLKSFRSAHSRLFEHLCQTTENRPDTLEGLLPLYQAVVHGCLAGKPQEAKDQIYDTRILRGTRNDGFYSRRKLGAIGADLGAVAAFFETPWSRLCPSLSVQDQAWLFNDAASLLGALGCLTEAREPMRLALEGYAKTENWSAAALVACNVSDLDITLGRLREAMISARSALAFADRSGNAFIRMINRASAAEVRHQRGSPVQNCEARALFEAAETLQRQRQPKFYLLFSSSGFRYCDLLLAPAERASWRSVIFRSAKESAVCGAKGDTDTAIAETESRATQTLKWFAEEYPLLDIALDHLTLARVMLYRAVLQAIPASAYQNSYLSVALDGLRKANVLHHLPKALLTAALHHHVLDDRAAVRRHLDEAQRIAERGPMPLYLADVHLHRARLVGSVQLEGGTRKGYEGIDPRVELAKARALIEKHGYGRRREELADAEAAAAHW